jgi:hypothetical protein
MAHDEPTQLTRPQRLEHLRNALSDPMDIRDPIEIGEDLGFTAKEIRVICRGKKFSKQVLDEFKEQMGMSAPIIFKHLIRQAKGGSTSATKLYLESMGFLKGSDTNIHFHAAESSANVRYDRMTDEELDKDITRLLREITPEELITAGSSIEPANFEVVNED